MTGRNRQHILGRKPPSPHSFSSFSFMSVQQESSTVFSESTRSSSKQNKGNPSRFVRQAQISLQAYQDVQAGAGLLEFMFQGCVIFESDVKAWKRQIGNAFGDRKRKIVMHVSFKQCCIKDKDALQALEQFMKRYRVRSLGFSLTDLDADACSGLILAASSRLVNLELSLRQEDSLGPLLDACSGAQLKHFKLDACFQMEHLVRPIRLEEVVSSIMLMQHLETLELTRCELDDSGLAILAGGLLALQKSLRKLNIQTSGLSLTRHSLPCFTLLLTELPNLDTLVLELDDCPMLLLPGESIESREHQSQFLQALGSCSCKTLCLDWSHVGWTEDMVLQVLRSISFQEKHSSCRACSLHIQDWDFVQNGAFFVDRLVEFLPQFTSLVELSLCDTRIVQKIDDENGGNSRPSWSNVDSEGDWWNDDTQHAVVEALYQNSSLRFFDLKIGYYQLDCFQTLVEGILQRNQKKQEIRKMKTLAESSKSKQRHLRP